MDSATPLEARVAALLASHRAVDAAAEGFRRAAVLVPLYEAPSGIHLLLTLRTDAVPTHKGQVSLPGGGYCAADGDLSATALREAEEEVGLRREDVSLVGRLDDRVTVASAHVVRPFVGVVPFPYPFAPDRREIAALIHLPLADLLAAPFRQERWIREGRHVAVLVQEYGGHTIWGLTARILDQLVARVARPLLAA